MVSAFYENRICAVFDSFVLYVDGHSCVVESETLYKALESIPDKQRAVLLLDF